MLDENFRGMEPIFCFQSPKTRLIRRRKVGGFICWIGKVILTLPCIFPSWPRGCASTQETVLLSDISKWAPRPSSSVATLLTGIYGCFGTCCWFARAPNQGKPTCLHVHVHVHACTQSDSDACHVHVCRWAVHHSVSSRTCASPPAP